MVLCIYIFNNNNSYVYKYTFDGLQHDLLTIHAWINHQEARIYQVAPAPGLRGVRLDHARSDHAPLPRVGRTAQSRLPARRGRNVRPAGEQRGPRMPADPTAPHLDRPPRMIAWITPGGNATTLLEHALRGALLFPKRDGTAYRNAAPNCRQIMRRAA